MTWQIITNLSKQFTVEGDLSEAIKQMGDNVTTITAVRVGENQKECCGSCSVFDQCISPDASDHCQNWSAK